MKIVLCEDDICYANKIKNIILDISEKGAFCISVLLYQDGKNFINNVYQNKDMDLLILDIVMDGMNGIEVAKAIRKLGINVPLVFLTTYKNFVFKGYEVHAENYLLKTYGIKKIYNELEVIIYNIANKKDDYIVVKNDKGYFRVEKQDILFIETHGRNTLIHTADGEEIISYNKMKGHMELLGEEDFIRIHESYIVNIKYIDKILNNNICLRSGNVLALSKQRKKGVSEKVSVYFSNRLG